VRRVGEPRQFDFAPQSHWDLGPACLDRCSAVGERERADGPQEGPGRLMSTGGVASDARSVEVAADEAKQHPMSVETNRAGPSCSPAREAPSAPEYVRKTTTISTFPPDQCRGHTRPRSMLA
jgi:hypothetical protein